jgi:hypothetical protein
MTSTASSTQSSTQPTQPPASTAASSMADPLPYLTGVAPAQLARLADVFPADALEWRVQQADKNSVTGKLWARLAVYVDARAVMARLDEVCGVGNWQVRYRETTKGLMAGIGIRVATSPERGASGARWMWKWDGAGYMKSSEGLSESDAAKGTHSQALKRAAIVWGIGRYLYEVGTSYAVIREEGEHRGRTKGGEWFNWDPPKLAPKFLPAPQSTTQPAPAPARQATRQAATTASTADGTPAAVEAARRAFLDFTESAGVFSAAERAAAVKFANRAGVTVEQLAEKLHGARRTAQDRATSSLTAAAP